MQTVTCTTQDTQYLSWIARWVLFETEYCRSSDARTEDFESRSTALTLLGFWTKGNDSSAVSVDHQFV